MSWLKDILAENRRVVESWQAWKRAAIMTRMELLSARANDVVEVALSKGVCLSEAECLIVREAVLAELLRVEREVWGKLVDKIESEMEKENESTDDQIWEIRDWLVVRRQELT